MNTTLLQSQFDQLVRNPTNTRLLKQLTICVAALMEETPDNILAVRNVVSVALRSVTDQFACGTLTAMYDMLTFGYEWANCKLSEQADNHPA